MFIAFSFSPVFTVLCPPSYSLLSLPSRIRNASFPLIPAFLESEVQLSAHSSISVNFFGLSFLQMNTICSTMSTLEQHTGTRLVLSNPDCE